MFNRSINIIYKKVLKPKNYIISSQRNNQIIPRTRSSLTNKNINQIIKNEEGNKSVVKFKKDPTEKIILLIGGEESAYVGMCESSLDLPNSYELFKKAESVFGFNLIDLCLNGPKNELYKTKYLLPCIFVSNLIAIEKAKLKYPRIITDTAAITSSGIGELNALVFNDVMKLDDAFNFLKIRTDAVNLIAEKSNTRSILIYESAATNISFMLRSAKEWCVSQKINEKEIFCEITHWLHPETKIIGGHEAAINFIIKNQDNFRLKKIINLKYDIAHYSSFLKPVEDILLNAARNYIFQEPTIKIHSTTGYVYTKNNLIKNLSKQVHYSVKLERNFTFMYKRLKEISFPLTYECSTKRSISVNLKKFNLKAYLKCKTILSN